MKRLGLAVCLVSALAVSSVLTGALSAQQQQQQQAIARTHLKVGDMAPDFEMLSNKRERVKLSDFRGKKNVVLAFYVLAFTGG